MFFSCSGQIRPAGQTGASGPDDLFSTPDGWSKKLVFKIAIEQIGFSGQVHQAAGFLHISAQRLLAGHTDQLPFTFHNSLSYFFHDFSPGKIGRAYPDSINGWVSYHLGDRLISSGLTNFQFSGQLGGFGSFFLIKIKNSQDVGAAHPNPGSQVKTGYKTSTDKANAQIRFLTFHLRLL